MRLCHLVPPLPATSGVNLQEEVVVEGLRQQLERSNVARTDDSEVPSVERCDLGDVESLGESDD